MKQRCPHCQTTPLRVDAATCWYCGKDYVQPRKSSRPARAAPRLGLARRRSETRTTSAGAN